MLYHGSVIKELKVIKANAYSHALKKNVAYFTEDRIYALICCRKPEENFVTMGLRDGKQHYFERFPNQLKVLYKGKKGYLYKIFESENLINTSHNTWESITDIAEQKMHANYIRDHIDDEEYAKYKEFLLKHFSTLWD